MERVGGRLLSGRRDVRGQKETRDRGVQKDYLSDSCLHRPWIERKTLEKRVMKGTTAPAPLCPDRPYVVTAIPFSGRSFVRVPGIAAQHSV
jgi:hypothetical protein